MILPVIAAVIAAGAVRNLRAEPVSAAAHVSGLGGMIRHRGALGADMFFDLQAHGFRATFGLPLRFHPGSGLRHEDWDETTDYGRIAREVSYSDPRRGVAARLAPLSGFSLGVGNLVSLFYSTLDTDHWRTGASLSYQGAAGGLDAFLDSFLDPEVLGARLFVRPLHSLNPDGLFGRFEIGGTLVGDLYAPESFLLRNGVRVLDSVGLPRASRRKKPGVGVDARWPVIRSDEVEVVPYFALSHAGNGAGWHAGLALGLHPGQKVRFDLQAEYRRLGAGYVASYFGSLYPVDRWDIEGSPQAAVVRSDEIPRRFGFAAGVNVSVAEAFSSFLLFDLDRDGRFTAVRASGEVHLTRRVSLTLVYLARGFEQAKDILRPHRVVFAAMVEGSLSRFFTVFGSYSRDPTVLRGGADLGRYGASDTLFAGVRLSFGTR